MKYTITSLLVASLILSGCAMHKHAPEEYQEPLSNIGLNAIVGQELVIQYPSRPLNPRTLGQKLHIIIQGDQCIVYDREEIVPLDEDGAMYPINVIFKCVSAGRAIVTIEPQPDEDRDVVVTANISVAHRTPFTK